MCKKVHVYTAAVWDDGDAGFLGLCTKHAPAGGPGRLAWGPGCALLPASKDTDQPK